MSDEILLTQLRRMLAEPFPDLAAASAAIGADPGRLAQALIAEASASDDVASVATAGEYLEARLAALAAAIPPEARAAVREAVASALARWA